MIKKLIIYLTQPIFVKLVRRFTTIPAYSLIDMTDKDNPKLTKLMFAEIGDAAKYIVDLHNMPLKKIKSDLKIFPCKLRVRIEKVYD